MARRPVKHTRAQLGTVRRLPSGRYQASYINAGQRFTAPETFDTEREAEHWLQAERVDRRRGAWLDPTIGTETLADYAAHWLEERDLAPRTRDFYERTLDRWILPRIGGRGVELGTFALHALTTAVIRKWHSQVLAAARESALERLSRAETPRHPARVWAEATERPVGASGRLPAALLADWQAAGAPTPTPAPAAAVEDSHPDAGRTVAAQAYRVLRAILTTAHDDGLIPANPCKIKGAGQVAHPERTIASPAEVDRLAELFPERLRAAVMLAAWSGLRSGEEFALARRHVDLEAGTVRIERALIQIPGQPVRFGNPKTKTSRRVVHLPAFVVDDLRRHLRLYVDAYPDALLFSRQDSGDPVTSQDVSRYLRKARLVINRPELTWHDLRHTSATLAYKVGASTREVMDRLGHTTRRAADIYQHAADDSDKLLAARLDELRTPAPIVTLSTGNA